MAILQAYAEHYISLGRSIENADSLYYLAENTDTGPLDEEDFQEISACLDQMSYSCAHLNLPVSSALIVDALASPPKHSEGFKGIVKAIMAEISTRQFLYVPSERARYFDLPMSDQLKGAFPLACKELQASGRAFALGMFTSSVFHAMRAAEIGMRSMAIELGVTFPNHSIELADWQNLIEQAEAKIKAMGQLPKSDERDQKIHFFSQAALQFRYFKDAWRVRVSHARETYDEADAMRVLNHTKDFFENIAPNLKEPS